MSRIRHLVLAALVSSLAACGGGGSNSSPTSPTAPTTPTTPTLPANRAPSITAITITPAWGVSQLTSFTMTAAANDPDGDALTYTWDFGDNTQINGQAVTKVYNGWGVANVRLTVSDGKSTAGVQAYPAATATETRQVVVGSMTGRWTLTTTACGGGAFTLDLTQSGGTVTGTFDMSNGFCAAPRGSTGRTDPAEPGKIFTDGRIEVRLKVGIFVDFYLRGQMESNGIRVTGGMYGSGFNGDPFTLTKAN